MNAKLAAGTGILVTRPSGQALHLAQLIEAAGGEPISFPALQIEPIAEPAITAILDRAARFDLMIFVSRNAARLALPQILKHERLHAGAQFAVVGPGTAEELKKAGVQNIISPEQGADSEALLEKLTAMRLDAQRALIVRGQGGREFLAESLRARGTVVEYLECYRRIKPDRNVGELISRPGRVDVKACLATSSSIVENLFDMAGAQWRSWLCGIPFIVSHPRVAAT
ncbi:MAG: uroporphyrinogen-III synthase, partial [Betaproteobacteria bacterium]